MKNSAKALITQVLKSLEEFDFITLSDLPDIDLYMDQVTTFMDQHLASMRRHEDDKIMTKTMINNYAKNNLLPPPEKKKYNKDHILLLIFIYYFKNIISISDIDRLFTPLTGDYLKNGSISLEEVYSEIFRFEKDQANELSREIVKKFNIAQESFPDCDGVQAEYLRTFALVCMLGFDVYMKKMIMERLIDQLPDPEETKKTTKKKDRN